MTKMFQTPGSLRPMVTWNPFTGCLFECSYCWARKLAEGRLKRSYPNGFVPEFHSDRLKVHFKPNDFVFVSSMGDISFAHKEEFFILIMMMRFNSQTSFLFCSKNPSIYFSWEVTYPDNLYLGITLETNRAYELGKAPAVNVRTLLMSGISHTHKFVSIEPVMDFDLEIFVGWIRDINPKIVEVGADNYHNNLPEPPPDKLRALLVELRQFVPNVIEKDGLERLL